MEVSKEKRLVIAAVDDLFFAAKIRATAEALGVALRVVKSRAEAVRAARDEQPDLIVVDLHAERCEPVELARELKADEPLRSVPLVGFFSHVHTALKAEAEAAGFDRVLPRSAFTKRLAEILQGQD